MKYFVFRNIPLKDVRNTPREDILYWSEEHGWGSIENADVVTEDELAAKSQWEAVAASVVFVEV